MNAVTDIDLVVQNCLDMPFDPTVTLVFRLPLKDMGECSVFLKIQPCGSWDFFFIKGAPYFFNSDAVCGKIKYLLNDPACVLVGYEFAFDFGMPFVSDGRAGSVVCSV